MMRRRLKSLEVLLLLAASHVPGLRSLTHSKINSSDLRSEEVSSAFKQSSRVVGIRRRFHTAWYLLTFQKWHLLYYFLPLKIELPEKMYLLMYVFVCLF